MVSETGGSDGREIECTADSSGRSAAAWSPNGRTVHRVPIQLARHDLDIGIHDATIAVKLNSTVVYEHVDGSVTASSQVYCMSRQLLSSVSPQSPFCMRTSLVQVTWHTPSKHLHIGVQNSYKFLQERCLFAVLPENHETAATTPNAITRPADHFPKPPRRLAAYS